MGTAAAIPIQAAVQNRPLLCNSNSLLPRTPPAAFISVLAQRRAMRRRRMTSVYAPFAARFDLSEIMGGRGLCGGEQGLQKELTSTDNCGEVTVAQSATAKQSSRPPLSAIGMGDKAFEKELFGLTGGFPGGEKGLRRFVEQNPPPPPPNRNIDGEMELGMLLSRSKPKPPALPLFLPGMIVIVKNPKNPFYNYCGIVQRVTDGKAGVLFEGGNWDRLITFQLHELERREKGPPMVNPKSAILESLVQKSEGQD